MKKTNIKSNNAARKDALPDNIDEFKQLLMAAQSLAQRQQNHIRHLEEIVKLFKANKFGKSSEKSPAQTELFDEAEVEDCDRDPNWIAEAIEPEKTAPAPSTTAVKSGRKPIPKEFPRIIIEYDLTDEEKRCSCGCEKQHIGDEVSEARHRSSRYSSTATSP